MYQSFSLQCTPWPSFLHLDCFLSLPDTFLFALAKQKEIINFYGFVLGLALFDASVWMDQLGTGKVSEGEWEMKPLQV